MQFYVISDLINGHTVILNITQAVKPVEKVKRNSEEPRSGTVRQSWRRLRRIGSRLT